MIEMDVRVAIYLVTGFLESGKSTFLDFTIRQDYFQIEEPSLLLLCEEGEVEFDADELKEKYNTYVEIVEKPEDFTKELLQSFERKYHPDRVLLEYNPLWSVAKLEQMEMPAGWGIVQHIVTVDSSTFQVYMNNMKSLFVEMVRNAELIIFNRADVSQPLANFRRSIKVVNPAAQIIFENSEGEINDIFDGNMPYDLDADIVEIADEDYGIFYVDVMENPEKYEGKTMRFKGMTLKSRELSSGYFVPGRMAMTCCADDTSFIGYICKSPYAKKMKLGDWVEVTATMKMEYQKAYHDYGPVFYASEVKPAEKPVQELVYFS